ncbi:MAG: DedA family protein [Bacteroidia bacterium]|nr:DedA family protein [Bacteroidia bacterium]
MEFFKALIDFVLHIDEHLVEMVAEYGVFTYAILFFIIFAETGFVVTPFLPGDSLLFAAGALAATGALNVWIIIGLLLLAAVLGNSVNYAIGSFIGPRIMKQDKIRFIKKEYLIKTQEFYEKHGVKAVILGRFLPFFRTFIPFVAGIGNMSPAKFSLYNLIGAVLWVIPFTLLGYAFGEIPVVKENFSLVVLGIIFVTVLPTLVGVVREVIKSRREKTEAAAKN